MGGTVGQQATNVLSVAWQSAARLKVSCAVQTANMQDRSRFVAAMNVNWTPSTTYFFFVLSPPSIECNIFFISAVRCIFNFWEYALCKLLQFLHSHSICMSALKTTLSFF
jgi:hypothetical protein